MGDKNDCQNNIYKSTPPPTNRKVRNPFDKALIDKLHKPICSPGMCKIYKKKSNGSFRWDIDQACTLVPADIVACNSQFEPTPDPALEKIAEEATDRFFSQEMVMPSPLIESSKKVKPLLQTSSETSIQIDSLIKEKIVVTKEVSAQTVLTLPPELPPELELLLQPFCTFTQEQNMSGEYEITANGSLRRKLFFEEHSDMEHYDSEQTDDEIHVEPRPPSSFEAHTPVVFSPDLSRDYVSKGMKRTFGTPLKKGVSHSKPCYRNKILDVVDGGEPCFSPIGFHTPQRTEVVLCQGSATSSSLASISPVMKASSDEEKNNFTSPETETMATCLDCIEAEPKSEKKGPCFCKLTPNKIKRSTSLKESPPKNRKSSFSFSEKRSLSMSSLHRSRSVQKLDFSMDMSVDGSFHNHSQADSESSSPHRKEAAWSFEEPPSIHHLVKVESSKCSPILQSSTKVHIIDTKLDDTPIKGKSKSSIRSHEISKIRAPMPLSPLHMSLDTSLDNSDNPLSLEDKKIDFNKVDLKLLTENISQFDYTANNMTKVGGDSSTSFKRVDSGFNENTFYANASSYYESAIKPSELTVTNVSKNVSKNALKEISNINWMRVDSGFKDENSSDGTQFYPPHENAKKFPSFHFSEAKLEDKENLATDDFDKFLVQSTNKSETMSMSDIFTDDMAFNCNFSSTPSKNKSRKVLS
ncbi:hypothetical protein PYW07_015411 [Mythimna separata]|uniref:Protein aurora borealis n=1 Tax=Mythimna separata TaxID=271217 RepID=A0AAD8DZT6_MYTSE|nr:hypothetical protein PYW07_015411 [Mythimna separata]